MATKARKLVLALCLVLIATACGGDAADVSERAEVAIADLASQRGVDTGDISVVSEEDVTWRDASLGCPDPDLLVASVLTPGFRIILDLDGTEYAYHGAAGQDAVFCASPDPNGTV